MKYFIVAGEASGDMHGANLMKELKKKDAQAGFVFLGGDQMLAQGGTMVRHYRQMAFMGLMAVIFNIRSVLKNIGLCKKEILKFMPDALILIDYAAFNLKIARFAKKHNLKVFFYISPKVWAWRESRVKTIKKYIDRMFVILPFETAFYRKHNYEVVYVGNPLLDSVRQFESRYQPDNYPEIAANKGKFIALLPGSREQEIELLLPEMLETAEAFPKEKFIIAASPSFDEAWYRQFVLPENVSLVYNQTYALLKNAKAAVVTSGTATLETALFRVPQVVLYKTGAITYRIGTLFVDIKKFKYFSLVNLILRREAVKEILQFKVASQAIAELDKIVHDAEHCHRIERDYDELIRIVGEHRPSEKLAGGILDEIRAGV